MKNTEQSQEWITRIPSCKESINASKDFEELWPSSANTVGIPVIDGRQITGIGTYVLARHAVETNRAILLLWNQGMQLQAIPLMRALMESAVTASWMTITKDSGLASLHFVATERIKLLNDLQQISSYENDGISQWEEIKKQHSSSASSEAKQFEQRCNSLEGGEGIYAIYRLLSGLSHPSLNLVESYTKQDIRSEHGFIFTDAHLQKLEETLLAFNTCMLALALAAWGKYEESGALALKVRTLGDRFGIRTKIAPKN